MKKWIFDNCYVGEGHVSLKEDTDDGTTDTVEVVIKDNVCLSIKSFRDQWGVFYSFESTSFSVAQEDQTLSFIDCLIEALKEIKSRNEIDTFIENPIQEE